MKPWIAIFDLSVTRTSPAGSCVLAQVQGLAADYDITVFSDDFENPDPARIRWVRIPLPRKPGFLRYMVFQVQGPKALRQHIRERGCAPTLVQTTQGQYYGADVCYPHFCHRAYLANQWHLQNATGLRRLARWISYRYNAFAEQRAFRKASWVVAPSQGLMRELVATYPFLQGKVQQVANPVDLARFAKPVGFDRLLARAELGLSNEHKVMCFAALGDFERKGLGIIIDALPQLSDPNIRLLVIGGQSGEIAIFHERAEKLGVADKLVFVGFQSDVRPYMWMSDVFVFPSTYEIFSLVLIQAPAAGLPVIATHLYGFEEYAKHGENCWVIERNAASVQQAIESAFADMSQLQQIGKAAKDSVACYGKEPFAENWRQMYRKFLPASSAKVGSA